MIALSQLNRAVESREDKRPRMADLRESGAIEQDADIVLLLHRPEYYDPNDQPGVAELIVAKNRNGATGSSKLAFIKKITRFENLATIAEPHGCRRIAVLRRLTATFKSFEKHARRLPAATARWAVSSSAAAPVPPRKTLRGLPARSLGLPARRGREDPAARRHRSDHNPPRATVCRRPAGIDARTRHGSCRGPIPFRLANCSHSVELAQIPALP